ncbi:MAG: hypothetical protein GY946_31540 [bacterium]|nr:hypothetical protein [bacterium]
MIIPMVSTGRPGQQVNLVRAAMLAVLGVGLVLGTGCGGDPDGKIPSDPDALQDAFIRAVQFGSPDRVTELINAGGKANSRDLVGWTPLHFAVNRLRDPDEDDMQIIGILVDEPGVEVDSIANDGSRPVALAVRHGVIEIVDLLLARGASFEARDDQGATLLMEAARAGHAEMAEHLIGRGADIEAQLPNGGTAVFIAAWRKRPAVLRLLIDQGAQVNGNAKAAAPIILAAGQGNEQVVKLLLGAGADVNAVNPTNGFTPLHRAIISGPSMVKLLLDAGAKPGVPNQAGMTPRDIARDAGQQELVDLLTVDS